MAIEPQHEVRERLNHVLLALQILARRSIPWERRQRIAQLGLSSARRLAELVLNRPERREDTT
jgi:hypothetical protein